MTYSQTYLTRAIDAMSRVDEISYRRIFGGVGIYHRGVQFAILVSDRLYFRADEMSRPLFQQRGMAAFLPAAASVESFFYQLPEELLDQPAELKFWMRIAVEASHHGEFLDDESSIDLKVPQRIAR